VTQYKGLWTKNNTLTIHTDLNKSLKTTVEFCKKNTNIFFYNNE